MKEYHCDLCGSSDAVEVPYARLYTNDQPIHICKICGFIYVKKRRTSKEIASEWSDNLFGKNYTARIPAVKARQTYVADYIDSKINLKGKKIIDIGAGEGQFLEIAKYQYGAEVFGIEPSYTNCAQMKNNGLDCFNGTIEDYISSRYNKIFDIATIMWTLEACLSCRDMIVSARKLLNNDCYIVVATGSRILVPFKKPLWEYLRPNPPDTHAFRFSVNTLKALLTTCGFKVMHVNRYIDTDYLVILAEVCDNIDVSLQGDNFLQVYDFFERWHRESMYYANETLMTDGSHSG